MKYLVTPITPFASNVPGAAGADKRIFTIASEHSSLVLTLRDEPKFVQIPGTLTQVSVGADGTVWGVNAERKIFKWTGSTEVGSTWTQVIGQLRQVSVGSAEHIWGVHENNSIFRWTGEGWEKIPGTLKQVAVASDGTVWGVQNDRDIFFRRGDKWEKVGGVFRQISVGSRSNVWGVTGLRDVAVRSGNAWTKILPDKYKSVSIAADGSAWGINLDGKVQRWRGDWEDAPGNFTQISVGSASDVWGVDAQSQIWRNEGTGMGLLVQARWTEDTRQQWQFLRQEDGSFEIKNVHSDLAFDVRGASKNEGADVVVFRRHGRENQRWFLTDLGDGRFQIDAKHSGHTIEVRKSSFEAGVKIVQRQSDGQSNQRWLLSEVRPSSDIFNASATLYEQENFQGKSLALGVGCYGIKDLTAIGNDKVSSLKVPSGLRVTLFEHADYMGKRKSFTADAATVGQDFDDRTSTAMVEKVATIYTGADFQGPSATLGVGKHSIDTLGIDNDTLSSLRVPQGLMVILHQHGNFKGKQWIYFEDTPQISEGFDNKTSSITIRQLGIEIPRDSVRFGGRIQLQSHFNKWLVAEDGGKVNANRAFARSLETFVVERHGPSQHTSHLAYGDIIALRSARGKYIASEDNGSTSVNRKTVGKKERWVVVRSGATKSNVFVSRGDVVSLRSWRGRFLVVTSGGGTHANSSTAADATQFTLTGYTPPNQVVLAATVEGGETQSAAVGGPCGAAVCTSNVCAVEACGADACGAEACAVDAALAGSCAAAAGGIVICGADVGIINTCGAAATGAGACGAAACGAAACGAAVCAAAATGIGVCGSEAFGVGACGAAACGADACGVAVCGAEACATAACGLDLNPVDVCGADGAGIDVCPADVCGANVCGINLCPADACAADACAIDIIPILPGI